MLALVGEGLAAPQSLQDLQGLVEALGPLPCLRALPAEMGEALVRIVSHPDAEGEATTGKVIQGDRLSGHLPRPSAGDGGDGDIQANPFRAGRDGRQDEPWIVERPLAVVAYVVLQGHAVPPRLLGQDPGFDQRRHPAVDALNGKIDHEVQGTSPPPGGTRGEFI